MGTLNKILGLPDDEQQTLTQQDATNVHPAKPDTPPTIESAQPTEGISDKQRNYPSTEATTPQTTSTTSTTSTTTTPKPSTATPTLTQQTEGSTRTHMSYVEMMKELSPYKPPTEEEIAKERRKQKRETVFAAIGDGLAAFNQAYANARGIKPVATVGMSGKVRERYEKLKRERDAQSQEYANAYIRARQADDALAQQGVTNLLAQRRQDRLDKETKIKEDKALAYQQYQAAVTSKNEEQAAYWRAKWEALEAGKDADTALKEAKAAQARAAARLANVRADAGGFSNTAGAGMGEYTTTTVVERDKRGRETGRKTTRTRGNSGNGSGSLLPGQGTGGNNGGGSLLPR